VVPRTATLEPRAAIDLAEAGGYIRAGADGLHYLAMKYPERWTALAVLARGVLRQVHQDVGALTHPVRRVDSRGV
jgi:hypothetical protein